jgi:hypothetical protein
MLSRLYTEMQRALRMRQRSASGYIAAQFVVAPASEVREVDVTERPSALKSRKSSPIRHPEAMAPPPPAHR